jgi:hypothetical protein
LPILLGIFDDPCSVAEDEAAAERAHVSRAACREAAADRVAHKDNRATLEHLEHKINELRLPEVLRIR